jgi:Swt1-like HEPN
MYGTKELREHLQQKLEIGPRQLRRLIAGKAAELPSTNEQALFVLAHENGMKLSNYLTPEQIGEVRGLVQGRPVVAAPSRTNGGARATRKSSPRLVSVVIANVKVGEIPGLKASHAQEAKAMGERVYPTMYLFENSVRDVIERVLKAKYGTDWWQVAVPGKVREQATQFAEDEKRDTWHSKRGRREIDYLQLPQLWKIIKHKWNDFEPLFPQGQAWVQSMIENDMNVSRRVIAHMNPLEADDIASLEASFRKWVKHLKAVADKLPAS